MKAPDLKSLAQVKPEDSFSRTVIAVTQQASAMVKKSYTIEQGHIDYINQEAVRMATVAGKPVTASEVLRAIIQRDIERTK